MKNQTEEMNIFCFRAVLGKVDGKGEFIVPFKVLSEDKYKAQSILEDWLKNPEQTGYKFTCCEGLVREPSERVLAKGYRRASAVAREIVNEVKETLLDFHLREDKKYRASKAKSRKQFEIETARYRAITDAIKFAIEALNEIEKKYESEVGE